MRHFAILLASALGACALPGASNVSGFMHIHPTQESCASRGLTLDATTKECVTPTLSAQPPPAAPPPRAAQVQSTPPPPATLPSYAVQAQSPSAGPAQPPPRVVQPAGTSVPIEPDAVIDPKLEQDSDQMDELAHFARASGYRCDSISALEPGPGGYQLMCNRSNYKYAIQNKGGRSVVTVE